MQNKRLTVAAAAAGFVACSAPGNAAGLLGLYVGAEVGQSRVEGTATETFTDLSSATYTEEIDKSHAAFAAVVGVRPVSLAGAEVDYIDFDNASGMLFGNPADISMKGAAVFGVLYLPVPVIDIYLKVGVANLESTVNGSICSPCACSVCRHAFQLDRTSTSGAGGAGLQYRINSWALRAEYERFNAAGRNPSLLSLGLTWSF
jgi:hypothetical protein